MTIFSNQVFTEYSKVYDMILNFKSFVTRVLISAKRKNLNLFSDALNNIKLYDFNDETDSMAQCVQMTACIDQIVSLSQNAFKKLVHELVSMSQEIQERAKQDVKLKQSYQRDLFELKDKYDKLIKENKSSTDGTLHDAFNDTLKSSVATISDEKAEPSFKLPKLSSSDRFDDAAEKSQAFTTTTENPQLDQKIKENENRINEMQRMIDNLKDELQQAKSSTDRMTIDSDDLPSLMFTRLDAERNAKRLKRGMNKGAVSEQDYQVR